MVHKNCVIKNKDSKYFRGYSNYQWAYFDELRKAQIFINDSEAKGALKNMVSHYEFHYQDKELRKKLVDVDEHSIVFVKVLEGKVNEV
jgi:hypothetical protein